MSKEDYKYMPRKELIEKVVEQDIMIEQLQKELSCAMSRITDMSTAVQGGERPYDRMPRQANGQRQGLFGGIQRKTLSNKTAQGAFFEDFEENYGDDADFFGRDDSMSGNTAESGTSLQNSLSIDDDFDVDKFLKDLGI